MKRFHFLCALMSAALVLMCATAFAVPAKRVSKTVTLTDGTQVTVTLRGDENLHYYATADGRIVEQKADGTYDFVSADQMKTRRAKAAQRRESMEKARRVKHKVGSAGNYIGKKKGLVILVNFKDVKLQSGTATTFPRMANEVGYKGNGHYGSVHDYFLAQSYGQFDLTFDVVGPVTVSQNMAYYGAPADGDHDSYPAKMVIEAINQVNDSEINFADYDWDNDGYVDQVYVIYAGYGQASGASEDTIWPHEWDLNSAKYYGDGTGSQKKDGKWINTYACSNELAGKEGTKLDGIGTMCHEFSHCLGLPDFYDTEGNNFGMDSWSIMDYGCYNSDGCIPCGYTAYERMFAGWLTPTELDEPATITGMPDINDQTEGGAPKAYIIYNKANSNEFYTLQNIQQTGWNQGAYGHGLLVGHIDFNQTAWTQNKVNTSSSHQRGTIIHADNEAGTSASSLAGDTFPGTSKNTSLTNITTPAATLYNNNSKGTKFLNGPLTEITEAGGLISFLFDGGEQAPSPELAWSKTYLSVDIDESGTPSFPTLTNTHGVSVTYESSNTAVATVSNTGVVTLTGTTGTATISAIFTGNDDYQAQTVTYTIVVYSSSAGDQPAGTLWEEDFGTNFEANKTTYQYDLTNTTFQTQDKTGTNILAGGESPELLIKANKTFSAVIPMNGHYGDMTLTFKSNRDVVTTTADGATLGDATITGPKPYVYTIPVSVSAGTEDVTLYFKAGSDNARFDDARLYQGEDVPTPQDPELSWSAAASSARINATDNLFPTLTNPHNVSVTYSSSNTAAATVNASTGAISLVAPGVTTISAIFAGNASYTAKTVTFQLTVLAAEGGNDDDGEPVTLWSEDFSSYAKDAVPTDGAYSYVCVDGGSPTKIWTDQLSAGGESPELLVSKNGGSFSATISMDGHSGTLTLSFLSNKGVTVTATNATVGSVTKSDKSYTYPITVAPGTTSITLTFTNSTSDNTRVDNFLLTAPASVDPQPQSAGLVWSTASYTATIDGENTFPTLTNPHGVTVSYSSSNTAAATINASTGAISLVAPGTTTISAKFNGNDDYLAQTVTYALTVEAAPVDITNDIENPYTIAEAYDLITAGEDLGTPVFVKGVITHITEVDVIGTYGNATYDISDNTTTAELHIFRGYGLDNVKFNKGAELIQIGDTVIVYGCLQNYNGTYEMSSGNYIVRLAHPTLTFTDGTAYSSNTAKTYYELTYTRTFGNTSWQALYLPFSLSYDDWKDELDIAEIYNIIQYDDNNDGSFDRTYLVVLHKTSGQTLPNRPYLVRAKTAGTFTRTLNNVTLQPAESKSIDCSSTFYTYTFTGIYAQRDASVMIANGDYALGGGELHPAASDANLKAQRWYVHITPREDAPTLLPQAIKIIEHGEETEGIEGITSPNGESPAWGYDLQGRKFSPVKGERREGLYIVGGKKVIR